MKKVSVFLLMLVVAWMPSRAQDVRSQLRQIAADLAKQIEAKGKKRVVIASFLDLKNQETELGRYMSDKFSIGMGSSSLEITDRSQLERLLFDNKLGRDRILDPKTIPTLGKITGAEVIITGNYTALDNTVDITVKAIDLERGLRIAVAEGTVARTSEINKLLSEIPTTDDITAVPTISTNPTLPNPAVDCKVKNTCVVCIKNLNIQPVEVEKDGLAWIERHHNLLINPNKTECWQDVSIGAKREDYRKLRISYWQNNSRLKIDHINIEACEVKLITFNK